MTATRLPFWTWAAPLAGWLLLGAASVITHGLFPPALGAGLIACVLAAVHHAEVVAHRVGEPYGTLVLALAVTVIEVALIVSLMITGGAGRGLSGSEPGPSSRWLGTLAGSAVA